MRRGETQFPYRLLPVYVIGVLSFTIDATPGHQRRVQLCDLVTGKAFYDKLTFLYIELPKFQGTLNQGLSLADQWVYLLRHMPALLDIPAELDKAPFTQAFKLAEEAALSPEDRARYERSWKDEMDERAHIMTAQLTGIEIGAAQTKVSIARALLAAGVDRATILHATGLTEEELSQL